MKIGDFVKYKASNGSTGKIVGKHDVTPDHYYVEWIFGKNINNEIMKSLATCSEFEVNIINEENYLKIYNRKGFGNE